MKQKILFIFILTSLTAGLSWAEDSDVEELNLIQLELDKSSSAPQEEEVDESTSTTRRSSVEPSKPTSEMSYEDLGRLSEFKQVSVIQRRYLPRTGRFQAYLGPAMTLNDAWFNVMGGNVKLGFNLSEAWGIEGSYGFMSTSKTMALKELLKENNITTRNFVYVKDYYTISANWTPLYGKMTWLNEKIAYYDIYFNVGYGGTKIQTNDVVDTFSIGAGQIFSITKAYAFRWDLSWNFFEAKQIDASQGTYNNVLVSAGFSFFFPEANYR